MKKSYILGTLLCISSLSAYAHNVIDLEKGQDLKTVTSNHEYCIVKAFLQHCKPCKDMQPIFEELSELHTSITCISMDCRNFMTTCSKLGIRTVPTFLFYKNGELVGRHIGLCTEASLTQKAVSYFGL